MSDNRYERQSEVLPDELRQKMSATVIGTGAIGRQVALMLATIGVPVIDLFDHDSVEAVNLATQGFPEQHIGLPKVSSVSDAIQQVNGQCRVRSHIRRANRAMELQA